MAATPVTIKKLTLWYLVTYLAVGGLGLAFMPGMALELFLSTGDYGDVMPRLVGMFMLVLSGLIAAITVNQDFKYYPVTLVARSFIVVFMGVLYSRTDDPLFLVLIGIVLVGLIPGFIVQIRGG